MLPGVRDRLSVPRDGRILESVNPIPDVQISWHCGGSCPLQCCSSFVLSARCGRRRRSAPGRRTTNPTGGPSTRNTRAIVDRGTGYLRREARTLRTSSFHARLAPFPSLYNRVSRKINTATLRVHRGSTKTRASPCVHGQARMWLHARTSPTCLHRRLCTAKHQEQKRTTTLSKACIDSSARTMPSRDWDSSWRYRRPRATSMSPGRRQSSSAACSSYSPSLFLR